MLIEDEKMKKILVERKHTSYINKEKRKFVGGRLNKSFYSSDEINRERSLQRHEHQEERTSTKVTMLNVNKMKAKKDGV